MFIFIFLRRIVHIIHSRSLCLSVSSKDKTVHFLMVCYSVACALFIAVYIYDTTIMPFVLPMAEDWDIIKRTIFEFYMYSPVHATLYFMGVSTMFLIRKYKEVYREFLYEMLLLFFAQCFLRTYAIRILLTIKTK